VIGGFSLVDKEISESVEKGQYYSLLFAFLAIVILLSIIFKSLSAGLLGSLPLLFAVCCTFGLMGWLGIELNIVTALLSSISIGLGVDFTIHIFWRLKTDSLLEKHGQTQTKKALCWELDAA
jgi:predicted RND superfamily exporter protein